MANILVVEDEVLISELIRRNLSLVGHGCDPAFDGDEALEKLSGGRYDLMILDVMIPKRDGFAVMEELMDKVRVRSRVGEGTTVILERTLKPRE